MNGRVVHFEVPAKNMKRAKAFYSKVFGWKANDLKMPGTDYSLVSTTEVDKDGRPSAPGSINGGLMKMTKPFTGPVVTLQVDDIVAALKAVEKNGGETVTKKTSMGEWGSFGYFRDSEGNLMGLFQT
ncbi:MAG: VOC family protein [Thaumarchaeota archaeon]|nr:VOC family protein [Nitrososphaerota archaeon]